MNPDRERLEAQCSRWVSLFSELEANGVPTLEQLSVIAVDDVRFSDPFNDVHGLESLQRVFEHTLRHVRSVRFNIHETAWTGRKAYVRWTMTGQLKIIGEWCVEGVSEIGFADDGRVAGHVDHWDAASQFYARLPIIGWLLRRTGVSARIS
jgi:hypothetical protein